MSSMPKIFYLTIFLGLFFVHGQDLISSTCNQTLYSDVCLSSLRSDPRSGTADLFGLANIALNISTVHGLETLVHINHLLQSNAGNDTGFNSCLSDCNEEYTDATENLQEAVRALRVGSFETLKTLVSSAMTDSDTCEDGFEGYGSPFTQRNLYFNKLCSNFLAITTLL